ncbi:MAG TPA: histidinol-phosphatase [Geminicoccaceae bacterium]|nr:histidinol-phosphatase [Geminicoccus sp.]HMU52477.1 histidinol-phosphatase [Geminicoccaceae bacterium]
MTASRPAPPPAEALSLAHALADAAGVAQRRYFRTPVSVESKADESPVTIADREAEQVMRDLIRKRFPGHGILGEEFGSADLDAEFVWVLDPIDGTKSFITGRPLFGTLIALLHGGVPVLGIIDQSIIGERWQGVLGEPSTHNGKPIRVRSCATLDQAVLFATSPRIFDTSELRRAYQRLEDEVRLPMFGGDCYAYGLLAMGFADLVVEASLQPYDFMALIPVITGAGGMLTDWSGGTLTLRSGGAVIAAGDGRTHAAARAVLNLS